MDANNSGTPEVQRPQAVPSAISMARSQKRSNIIFASGVLVLVLCLSGVLFLAKHKNSNKINNAAIVPTRPELSVSQPTSLPTRTQNPEPTLAVQWQTYTNTVRGFSFEYPKTWVNKSANENHMVFYSCYIADVQDPGFTACAKTQASLLLSAGSNDYVSNTGTIDASQKKESMIIGRNQYAVKTVSVQNTTQTTLINFNNDGGYYTVELDEPTNQVASNAAILDHMLSTVTFTSPQTSTPAEYELLKDIYPWDVTYQESTDGYIGTLACSDGNKGTHASSVFALSTKDNGHMVYQNQDPQTDAAGDIETKVISVLTANGWKLCGETTRSEDLANMSGHFKIFVKNNRLIISNKIFFSAKGINQLNLFIQY